MPDALDALLFSWTGTLISSARVGMCLPFSDQGKQEKQHAQEQTKKKVFPKETAQ